MPMEGHQTPLSQLFRSWCLHPPHLWLQYHSPQKSQAPGWSQLMSVPGGVLLIQQDYLCRVLIVHRTPLHIRLAETFSEPHRSLLWGPFYPFLWGPFYPPLPPFLLPLFVGVRLPSVSEDASVSSWSLFLHRPLSWWISHPLDSLGIYFKENLIESHQQWYFMSFSLLCFFYLFLIM